MTKRQVRDDRRGFALPVTIFVVTLLTIMLATGFARVTADRQIGSGSEYTTEALAVAQSGLQRYLGIPRDEDERPPDGDSVRINVSGGFAWVVARVVQDRPDPLSPDLFLVRSTGFVVESATGDTPMAQRTIAQYALWQVGTLDTRGALVAANRVRRRNNAGTTRFDGNDRCDMEPAQPAIRTTSIAGPPPDQDESASGSPVPYLEEGGPAGPDIADASDIDWAATIGPGLIPDYTEIREGAGAHTIQRVQGDAVLQDTWGSGLLIVTGNLHFEGGFAAWFGVILVGGAITFDSEYAQIHGAVVTGLNIQLGQQPPQTLFGGSDRNLIIRNDSCEKHDALAGLTGLAAIPNTWMDHWATY